MKGKSETRYVEAEPVSMSPRAQAEHDRCKLAEPLRLETSERIKTLFDALNDIGVKLSRFSPCPTDAEALARRFHEIYERLAPSFGYETRKETRAFNPRSVNGELMIAVCAEIGGACLHRPTCDEITALAADAAKALVGDRCGDEVGSVIDQVATEALENWTADGRVVGS